MVGLNRHVGSNPTLSAIELAVCQKTATLYVKSSDTGRRWRFADRTSRSWLLQERLQRRCCAARAPSGFEFLDDVLAQ
jgi:hypothetical protein